MRKEATVSDLKKLVDTLVKEGYCNALIGYNNECQIYLGKDDGMIKFHAYHSKQGVTYIDILN